MSGVSTTGPPWAPWLCADAAPGWRGAVGEVSLSQAAKATIAAAATAATARERGNVSGGMRLSGWGSGAQPDIRLALEETKPKIVAEWLIGLAALPTGRVVSPRCPPPLTPSRVRPAPPRGAGAARGFPPATRPPPAGRARRGLSRRIPGTPPGGPSPSRRRTHRPHPGHDRVGP